MRRLTQLMSAFLVIAILVACGGGDDQGRDEDRQFANDPKPTREATSRPTHDPTRSASPRVRATDVAVDPAEVLSGRGGPASIYIRNHGNIHILRAESDRVSDVMVTLPTGTEAVSVAASPLGDRAGVLLRNTSDGTYAVVYIDDQGAMLSDAYSIVAGDAATPAASPIASPVSSPVATPVPVQGSVVPTLTWEPQGDSVLVSVANSIVQVHHDGTLSDLTPDAFGDEILIALWSPMGGEIAIHGRSADGSDHVYVMRQGDAHAREIAELTTPPSESITELTWMPNGAGFLYLRGVASNAALANAQLFMFHFDHGAPKVVATSGQAGPSATMAGLRVAPSGHAVAYAIIIPSGSTWQFHSLWVRSLKTNWAQQVPVVSNDPVTNLRWTRSGLVWSQERNGFLHWFRFTPELKVVVLETLDSASPQATPAGSPIATPVASPEGTPLATPVGSPAATPIGEIHGALNARRI